MEVIETGIRDLLIIRPRIFGDSRGYFCETYNEARYREAGITQRFCQDNLSKSCYGVIRGLHFQLQPASQAKLVSVVQGRVYDVAVDLRQGSPTYGRWYGVELDAESKTQFLIPQGFAHGFSVLSPEAVFTYKCDNLYAPQLEGGIRFDDPDLGIDWKIPADKRIISEKDTRHPFFKDLKTNFTY
ncbi:MAG: dTDP-4-dehydrorhamnose 3,5-epimerase [Paludibacteraceae bacterium]|nr:dTDP-4-dehydrorhamnose 3,5-epimerase [Paludibacteraceae bacterium]